MAVIRCFTVNWTETSTVGMTHPSFWVGILPKGSYKQQVRRVPL